jgi:putative oxidoreductase
MQKEDALALHRYDETVPRPMPLADGPPTYYHPLPGSLGDILILVGRILVGQLYVVSGFGKLMGLSAFAASLQKNGVPAPDIMAVIGACVEFFGGLALVLGFMTRWSAVLVLIFTIVATMIGHRYWEIADAAARRGQEVNFYKNVTIIGGFFWLMVTGGGRFSIDGLWRR